MAVLALSEESRALREAAKGWSSGNVPIEDYRMIRRATLAAMLDIDPDEEDTIAGVSLGSEDVTEAVHHYPSSGGSDSKRNLFIIIGAAAVLVVGASLALLFAS